ncbi:MULTISPECIES: ethanolamine ammonia-lyase reactivating factor EutA [unclassified Beijerinckia]|uniref:ethanolamine ammonia-lyase reactivating factor EutA n=1 Tax=unclassified Beijerinckia TaxID=2638183 RepID=UPI0008960616|nr:MULTISPECIES: ethanolamine ammonia-lyase reactivating factor EutA [unclassified Beijerinckia]MDH7799964.1 ethanolamine utilization protein EutA [Beijerinckia sp. GAS462]SED44162.1 Reactivating factor of Adenosylcobalamin-dependent ethanolamine ammonia lyase [Beijerinckia sp. 28-YEA-48]
MSPGERPKPGKPHTLADHRFGADTGHVHGPGEDHDHDHDGHETLEPGSTALELVPLLSLGIDIGSSSTQVVFSRLMMRGPGEPLAMRRNAKSRETLYRSPIAITPFTDANMIDAARLHATIDRAYTAAGLSPDDIETGAIILTGAAAQRDNARTILDTLSAESGELIAAVAGHHMEAALAAYGSGAVETSRRDGTRLLNVDVGGATTKLALVEAGRVHATAALRGGGRLVALDREDRIVRLDDDARAFAARIGLDLRIGAIATRDDLQSLAETIADTIASALAAEATPDRDSLLTAPLPPLQDIDGLQFSGGVAEYVYDREKRDFGDLGWRLGRALRRRCADGTIPWPLLPSGECIGATVLGASEFTVQMSGATSFISSHATLLPRRNLPVLQPPYDFSGAIDADALAQAIVDHRRAFGDDDPATERAFAFRWRGDASWPRLTAFARGLSRGLADRIATGGPLWLICEGDVALNLGGLLRDELGLANDILVIDGIVLRDFDYVDLGRIRLPSGTLPVTIKSLTFANR